jgi:hypothetical protein
MQFSGSILLTTRLTAETAEIAEITKNCMRIASAFLCELGGEILSFFSIKPADVLAGGWAEP